MFTAIRFRDILLDFNAEVVMPNEIDAVFGLEGRTLPPFFSYQVKVTFFMSL